MIRSADLRNSLQMEIDQNFSGNLRTNSYKTVNHVVGEIFSKIIQGSVLTKDQAVGVLNDFRDRIEKLQRAPAGSLHYLQQTPATSALKAEERARRTLLGLPTSQPTRGNGAPPSTLGLGRMGMGNTQISSYRPENLNNSYNAFGHGVDYAHAFKNWHTGGRDAASRLNGPIFRQTMDVLERSDIPQAQATLVRPMMQKMAPPSTKFSTQVEVLPMSTFQASQKLRNEGYNPLALDMASATRVGGDPGKASAQEETLIRQSNMGPALLNLSGNVSWDHNPEYNKTMTDTFARGGGIYVSNGYFFRNDPTDGYAFVEPFPISFFASAAYDLDLRHDPRGHVPAGVDYTEGTKEKLRTMFRTARQNGHDSLVLSAFGCGAFKNEPEVMAKIFRELLQEEEFAGAFRKVVFGIIDMAGSKNCEIFKRELAPLISKAPVVASPTLQTTKNWCSHLFSQIFRILSSPFHLIKRWFGYK